MMDVLFQGFLSLKGCLQKVREGDPWFVYPMQLWGKQYLYLGDSKEQWGRNSKQLGYLMNIDLPMK